jgi:hypothetical protein
LTGHLQSEGKLRQTALKKELKALRLFEILSSTKEYLYKEKVIIWKGTMQGQLKIEG